MASPMQEITAKQTPTNAGAKFSSEKASISVKCELGVDFCRDCVCVCVCVVRQCVSVGEERMKLTPSDGNIMTLISR